MAANIYDDAVEQLAPIQPAPTGTPAKENPYTSVVEGMGVGQEQALRTSLVQAGDQAPDRAAEVRKLSDRTGVAPDIVERNFDDIRKRSLLVDTPYNAMLRDTPALSTWASEPANAAVSHDDMDKLGALEWLVSMPSRAISQSLNEQAYGELRTKSLFQPLTQAEQDQLSSYKYHATLGGELGAGNSWFKGALTKTMKLLTTLAAPEAIPTAVGAAGGAIIGGAGGFLMGGVGAVPGAVAGGKLGAEAGYAYGLGKSAFQTAAASSYDEYLELKDNVGRPLDPEVAKAAALVNGAVNAGLMTFGGKAIAAGMDAGGARVGQLLTKNAIKGALKQPSVVGAIAEMMKTYGTTLTEGTALMVAMKASDIIAGSIANATGKRAAISGQLEPGNVDLFAQPAVKNADGSISTVDSFSVNVDGREVLLPTVMPDGRHLDQAAALEEYQKTGRHLGVFDSPASATAFAQKLHEDYAAGKYTPPSIGRQLLSAAGEGLQSFSIIGLTGPAFGLAREVQRARRAAQGEAFFTALGEGVVQSKTAQRLPEGAQAFLEQATKDGPVKNVYAPTEGWSKYWQDAGVDPAAMAAEVTGRPDALEQAQTTGLLEIPTARYATKLAGSEHNAALSRILKLDPDAMNSDEAQQLVDDIQAGKHDQAEPEAEESPVRKAVREKLEKVGVTGTTAEAYADVYDAAFGTMAQRAGVDPAELFSGYGLDIQRPDLPADTGEKPAAAGEAARPEANGEPVDGQGRPIVQSDYTGPERRAETVQAAASELRRRSTDEPIPAMADVLGGELVGAGGDIARRAAEMRRENPDIDKQAAAMRAKAAKAGRIKEPAEAAALRSGAKRVVDKKADAAQNPESYFNAEHEPSDTRGAATVEEGAGSPNAEGERSRVDEVGAQQGRRDGGGAEPRRAPAGIPELDEVFKAEPAEHTEQRLTPEVERELRRVRDELDRSGHEGATWTWLADETGLKGNVAGGHANKRPGHGGAAVYHDVLAFSPMNVTTSGRNKGKPAERAHGDRAKVQRAIEELLETRHATSNLMEGALRVAENRDAGIYRDLSRPELPPSWGTPVTEAFTDALSEAIDRAEEPAGNMLADAGLEQDAVDSAEGDTSFDITEFSQGLFDELEPPDPKVDTLAETGEQQPRLPGDVGDVREKDVATPEFELPFSLTSEVAKPKGKQTTLFQDERAPITTEDMGRFAQGLKNVYGSDLARLELSVTHNGDISLDWIVVDRGAQRSGVGMKVMRDVTRIADLHGKRIVLSPAEDGGSTRSRLVAFYKRFGFVENKGRNRDFSTRAGMYRDPSVVMGQPLFHGSPHDFERFSLEHVGTGEGAAAYGHGLYFAENPAVAANYHDQLSEGRDVVKMKLGKMKLRAPNFDYTKNAHVDNVENLRASIAEDLLSSPLDLNAAGEAGFRDHVLALVDQKIADYEKEFPEGVEAGKKLRAELEKPGALSVEFTKTKGGVYQVDIPDEHLEKMLDWDSGLDEQPASVQAALAKIDPDLWSPEGADYDPRETGASIYHRLADKLKTTVTIRSSVGDYGGEQPSAAAASKALLAAGVPGLRYLDQHSRDNFLATSVYESGKQHGAASFATRGEAERWARAQEATAGNPKTTITDISSSRTRNVVVFDDSIVTLTHKDGKPFTAKERKEFFQGERGTDEQKPTQRRGAIRFGADRQFAIDLLERSDLSTFLHESGHFFLEVFSDLADKVGEIPVEQLTEAQRHMLSDYGALLQHLGVENREGIGTPQHEQFARSFEAYLMEGKAPSAALRTPFARFRAWLVGVYQSLKKLNVNLSPDVRGVMDRLLASDQAIADAEAQRGTSRPCSRQPNPPAWTRRVRALRAHDRRCVEGRTRAARSPKLMSKSIASKPPNGRRGASRDSGRTSRTTCSSVRSIARSRP
jgi:ribosomal protein S18 acetylase RimI-like enzyme